MLGYIYIYIYIYMRISLNVIDILCLHIFFWIRSNSRITFIVFGGNWFMYCPQLYVSLVLSARLWAIIRGGQYINQFPPKTIKVIREFERIQKKICSHKMCIMFNKICINEEMLPKYTYTHTHTHTHIYLYTWIFLIIMSRIVEMFTRAKN